MSGKSETRPYLYAGHIVPHDAQAKELGTGKSRLEVLESLGLKNITVAQCTVLKTASTRSNDHPALLVRRQEMRSRYRCTEALPLRIRRQAASTEAEAGS
jgi:hypothetical protein